MEWVRTPTGDQIGQEEERALGRREACRSHIHKPLRKRQREKLPSLSLFSGQQMAPRRDIHGVTRKEPAGEHRLMALGGRQCTRQTESVTTQIRVTRTGIYCKGTLFSRPATHKGEGDCLQSALGFQQLISKYLMHLPSAFSHGGVALTCLLQSD